MAGDSPVEAKLRQYVNDLVHGPLKQAGYRRSGRVWRSVGNDLVRAVDLQRERRGPTISFTLNVGIAVPGYNWYLFGFDDEQPDASLGVVSGRVGYAFHPPRDVWFVVSGEGGLMRTEWTGPESPSDGSDLSDALNERVVPTLARFSSPRDVLAYLEEPTGQVPFLGPLVARNPEEGLRAVIAWRAAGSPVPSVAVRGFDDTRIRVEAPQELVDERPDLVAAMVEVATPVDDGINIREVVSVRPGVFEISGRRLRADRMKGAYERFLAVRRYGASAPPRTTPRWPSHGEEAIDLGDVNVEPDEDGDELLVTFSDEVAHEHVDLVAECLERCRSFTGVEYARWPDREVIVLRGRDVDRNRLEEDLRSFVRDELSRRDEDDHRDDQ
ncbi:MAG: DUF4304 domain-containing protein [Acidimicrobiia bacterium]